MRDFHLPGRSDVFGENGMVATSHPLASQNALSVLQNGGNAVDAAISSAVLLGICEPQMTGIGGDCFVIMQPADGGELLTLNGSGRAPAALRSSDIAAKGHKAMPVYDVDAVTVPGAIDAFCKLAEDHGSWDMAAILKPAIHYAENGVPVGPRSQFDWALAKDNLQGAARDYFMINGKVPSVGQKFAAPGQAKVMRAIATKGRDGFYKGEVAQDMVDSLNALGGVHTLEDFAATKCDYGKPIHGNYRGYKLSEHPPNGQGVTAILMNNILAKFDIAGMDPFGADRAHIEAEASKLAYDARNRHLADPEFMSRMDHLMSEKLADDLAELIDPKRAIQNIEQTSEAAHRDTIYITVVDKDRMAVSLIYSVFHSFGAGIASDKFGINFQNRGAGFNLISGHPNEAMGGKRPMHTIIPAFLDGPDYRMPFGVMGGAYQPNGHARLLSNLIDFDMGIQEAIDAPRSFADLGKLGVERGYSDAVRADLAEKGHEVIIPEVAIGGAQAIQILNNGMMVAGSDPRKDGCALGY